MRSLIFAIALFLGINAGPNSDRFERHREALKDKEKYPGCCAEPISLSQVKAPHRFDWCDVDGKSYCAPSWNQHQPKYCGACYVHGTLSALNDRLKIMRKGEGIDTLLARQVILNCGSKHGFGNGCGGGESSDIFEFMRQIGLGEEGCYNYQAEEQPCPANGNGYCTNCMMFGGDTTDYKCWPVDKYVKYYVKEYGFVTGEEQMKAEIYARGPITCGLVCPDEFTYGYKGGVMNYHGNETDVDHDVEVVGWGEEDGVPYWKVRNSWGTYWGEDGFFRVVRGKNMLRIEESCAWATLDRHEEVEMRAHKITGSMFGVTRPNKDAWRFLPADPKDPLKNKPHHTDEPKEHEHNKHGHQKPPVTLVEFHNNIPEASIGFLPIFAFILISFGLYMSWRFYAPKSLASGYQEI